MERQKERGEGQRQAILCWINEPELSQLGGVLRCPKVIWMVLVILIH
jgi:hypothetical protein